MTEQIVPVACAEPLVQGSCRVIAEAGANHNNSIDQAVELTRRAADAGAWAIKFQMYKAERLAQIESEKYWTDDIGTRSQYEAFKLSDHLPYGAWQEVAAEAKAAGIVFFSTPFDFQAVAELENINVPLYKVASADITHAPLLREISKTGKPILLSTGASTFEELQRALEWIGHGPELVVPLACTLTYPTPDPDGSFARIEYLRQRLPDHLIGCSDHTLGTAGAWMASALGAVCIEKHYTLANDLPDVPDHPMSVIPSQLEEMVSACERGAVLRGRPELQILESELPARRLARRSIVAAEHIPAGTVVTEEMLDFRRPGMGISPFEFMSLVGQRTMVDVAAGSALRWDWFQGSSQPDHGKADRAHENDG